VLLASTLSVEEIREQGVLVAVEIRGRLNCASRVTIQVEKTLRARTRTDGRYEVLGLYYSYHAWWDDKGMSRDLLRYDSAPHPGLDELHRHVFDPATGIEILVESIGRNELPTLDQVIVAAVEWRRAAGTEM
jgi:hypothetical protein